MFFLSGFELLLFMLQLFFLHFFQVCAKNILAIIIILKRKTVWLGLNKAVKAKKDIAEK